MIPPGDIPRETGSGAGASRIERPRRRDPSLASGVKNVPITTVINAMMIGYQRPHSMSPVSATMANSVVEKKPSNWSASD
jgi:hypothetical protein